MDNYFQGCPPMMNDGRFMTDYRSSQVREEYFKFKNCLSTENQSRTLRIDNADKIMDDEWDYLIENKSCFPQKNCYHTANTTKTSTIYNNAEILAYNGKIPAPKCNIGCNDFRMTVTQNGAKGRKNCVNDSNVMQYPADRYPKRCDKYGRILPDGVNVNSTT
jgi:hypothetical protein